MARDQTGGPAPGIPAWAPVAVYAVVTVLLFREFFLFGTSLLGMDSVALSYFARNFYTEFVQTFHRMPHWNPLLFGGLPFVEGMHGDIFYPPSLALFFMDARTMWGWKMGLHIFLAGVFTYLWLRRGLRLDRLPAFFGGLVYMMGADLVTLVWPGGDGKLFVSALAPLVFWLAERAVRGRSLADFALFALGVALILFTSHMQAAYYCVWGVSLYFLFRAWQVRSAEGGAVAARLVGLFALAGLMGVGAAAVQFLPPLEYLREHSQRADRATAAERGYEWSSTYSLNAEEIASLVVPEFVGEIAQTSPTRPAAGYWGKNPFKGNHEYAGLVPLLLVPILFLRRRSAAAWFFLGLAALSLLYALASSTPLGRVFYLIPGVSLFRSWSIIIFLFGLAVATLGALAAQRIQDALGAGTPTGAAARSGSRARDSEDDAAGDAGVAARAAWIAAGALAVLALLASAGVLMSVWTALFYDGMHPTREAALAANAAYIRNGFWIAALIAAAVAAVLELGRRGLVGARAALVLLAVLAAADLYRVGRPFVRQTALMNEQLAFSTLTQPDDVIRQLQQWRDEGGVFRVMDLGPAIGAGAAYNQNDFAIHGLEQTAGHHGNEMGRYRNLIGGEHADYMGPSNLRLANVTNTEFFVIPARIEHPALEEVYAGASTVVYRNRNVLPRAYLAGSTEIVTGDAAIERLLAEDFNAASTAILEEPLPAAEQPEAGAAGTVEWVSRGTDAYTLRVVADRPALLVVLDNHYPAWRASVDGREVPIRRANHAFRAITVPAGEHTVTFRYEPAALRTGAVVSLATLAVLLGVITAGFLARRRSRPA
jgi:hypothetical protein